MTKEILVYGDESGIDDPRCCVVAGFIATPRQWDGFNAAWRKVMEAVGVPEFHSKLFFSRRDAAGSSTNPFSSWSDSEADELLVALISVIKAHPRVAPIGCALDVRAFKSYTWGERMYLTGAKWNRDTKKFVTQGAASRVYPFPFYNMIGEALSKARPKDAKVHFIMDEQKVVQAGVQQVYFESRNNELISSREKLGELSPGLSEEHEGIQVADLLAYIWFGWYQFRERLRRERLDVLNEVWKRHHWEMGIVRKRGLEHVLSDLLPEDRAKIQSLKTPAEVQRERTTEKRGLD